MFLLAWNTEVSQEECKLEMNKKTFERNVIKMLNCQWLQATVTIQAPPKMLFNLIYTDFEVSFLSTCFKTHPI